MRKYAGRTFGRLSMLIRLRHMGAAIAVMFPRICEMRLAGMTCIFGLKQVVKFCFRKFGGASVDIKLNESAGGSGEGGCSCRVGGGPH